MLKSTLKLFLLILLVFIVTIFVTQVIKMLFTPDEFWSMNQILCSLDLDEISSQPSTEDHPVIPSPASTDLTKPKTKF